MGKVEFGADRVVKNVPAELRTARVGMVTSNVATVAFNGESSRVALRKAGVNLTKLFGPEHGLAATAADGAHVGDAVDPATRLPVVSLYGDTVRPRDEMLADVDVMLYDIPDVGARFYTYIWTLSHVMEACAKLGKPLYILDRPNPISGDLDAVEGPILDEANLASFVGRWNIPIRYSLTIGELASLWNAERKIGCELRIVTCSGWTRDMHWPATGLKFVPTSPNLPSYETALFYPGTCLIEGTKLSEGRGTDAPFRLIGAPWVDGEAIAASMNALRLPGVKVKAATFVPEGRKYAGERCRGVRLICKDAKTLRPVRVGLHLVAEIVRMHPREFEWLPYPTAASGEGLQHFDRLGGRLDVRAAIDAGRVDVEGWTSAGDWRERARRHLLYA
jgi:uncharacterized protein YbbC (DUF1343 family)